MNPILLKLLQGGLEASRAGVASVPYLLPSEAEKANRQALEQLQKAAASGSLGLTDAERNALYATGQASLDKQLSQNEAMLRQLGGVTATSGQAAKQAAAIASEAAKASVNLNNAVEQANIKAATEQRAEMAARQQAADTYKQNKVAAALAAPAAVLDFLQGSTAVDATVFGTETKEQKMKRMKDELENVGFTSEQAAKISERYKDDPEGLKKAMTALTGKPAKSTDAIPAPVPVAPPAPEQSTEPLINDHYSELVSMGYGPAEARQFIKSYGNDIAALAKAVANIRNLRGQ